MNLNHTLNRIFRDRNGTDNNNGRYARRGDEDLISQSRGDDSGTPPERITALSRTFEQITGLKHGTRKRKKDASYKI